MSKCFEHECNNGLLERMITPLLLHKIIVGPVGAMSISDRRVQSQMASFEDSKAAVYSALQEDVETVFCLQELHKTTAEPK
jgi:hypothetical protein